MCATINPLFKLGSSGTVFKGYSGQRLHVVSEFLDKLGVSFIRAIRVLLRKGAREADSVSENRF